MRVHPLCFENDTEKNKKVDGQELAASRFMDIIVMSVSVQQLELSFFFQHGER